MKRCKKCGTEIRTYTCQKCGGTDYEIVYSIAKDNPFFSEFTTNPDTEVQE